MMTQRVNSLKSEIITCVQNIDIATINAFAATIIGTVNSRKSIYLFGNGASASLANHVVADLSHIGLRLGKDKAIRAVSLSTNASLLTALSNDYGFNKIFSSQLQLFLESGDVVLGISVSGKSPNVRQALEIAADSNAIVLGLFGNVDNVFRKLCIYSFVAESSVPLVVEAVHVCFSQLLIASIQEQMGIKYLS
jgi:D-sedoheptulose 7-phosphate isomerase